MAGAVSPRERALAVTVLVAMASGVVVAVGDMASLPSGIVIVAAVAFIGCVVTFGVVTDRDRRSSGSSFGRALARSLRTAGRVFVALMP
jgi:hypothetical protein